MPDAVTIDGNTGRRRAIGAFAIASRKLLAERYGALSATAPLAVPVRGPQVGLVMLRGRAGGGGGAFNLGEATVSRASVRLDSGEVGHAMILGRDVEKARIAAHLDALWQNPSWQARIEAEIVEPALAEDAQTAGRRAEETEATRVDFFTLVRGED